MKPYRVIVCLLGLILLNSSLVLAVSPATAAGPPTATASATAAAVSRLLITPRASTVATRTGQTYRLTAVYSNGKRAVVTTRARWASSNNKVARPVGRGYLQALRAGRVRATATFGGKRVTATLTVRKGVPTSITVAPATRTVKPGQSYPLTVTGRFPGFRQNITRWSRFTAAPTGVVRLNRERVTALKPGTARVTASFGGKRGAATVKVVVPPPTFVVSPASATVQVGDTTALTATVRRSDGTETDVTTLATWSSADPSLVTVDAGELTGVAEGTTTVTATYGGRTARSSVEVTPTPTPTPESLAITPLNPEVLAGGTTSLTATLTLSDGSNQDVTPLATWTSADPATATIEGGVLTGVNAGSTTITAAYEGEEAVAVATVAELPASQRMERALTEGEPDFVTHGELVGRVRSVLENRESISEDLMPPPGVAMTWNPGNRGHYVTSYVPGAVQPILTANHNNGGKETRSIIGMAGTMPGASAPFAFLNANPFVSYVPDLRAQDDAGMTAFNKNSISWLLDGADPATTTADIRLVGIDNTAEPFTRSWFTTNLPAATVNANNSCNIPQTPTCLDGADLLVVGGQNASQGDMVKARQIAALVRTAQEAGVPVLTFSESWSQSVPLAMAEMYGFNLTSMFFASGQFNLLASGRDDQLAGGRDATAQLFGGVLDRITTQPFAPTDYDGCFITEPGGLGPAPLHECAGKPSAAGEAIQPFIGWVTTLRGMVTAYDTADRTVFDDPRSDDNDLLRLMVLLADKARTGPAPSQRPDEDAVAITYPIATRTDGLGLARAMFADQVTPTAWSNNGLPADLGTLWCSRAGVLADTCTPPVYPDLGDHTRTLEATAASEWQATGYTLPAAQPGTVRLTADPGMTVQVRTFYGRENTTRSSEFSNNVSHYDRPQLSATDWVTLTPGETTTISSPYGGPLYIRIAGSAATEGTPVSLEFGNVSRHPTILDMTDDSQLDQFIEDFDDGAYYADLAGSGFQAHTRLDYLNKALVDGVTNSQGRTIVYNEVGGIDRFLHDFRDDYLFSIYRLAGIKIGTTPLTETVPADVQAACARLGYPCLEDDVNSRTEIQHVNYDLHSQCGALCAGNPFDSGGAPIPFGWGESHELGHNLQRTQLNVHWVNTDNGTNLAAKNLWSNYANRSGEVSNNIFPYHVMWKYFRITHPGDGIPNGTDPDTANLFRPVGGENFFSIAQSIRSGISRNGQLTALNLNCTTQMQFPTGTNPDVAISDSIWKKSGAYDDNEIRMSFYQQMPSLVDKEQMAGLGDGFSVFTLLYQAARGFTRDATAARWMDNRSTYGMDLFDFTGEAPYGSGNVSAMPGNDFMLIQLNRITDYDWRPYFRAHGVLWSDLADQQIEANAPTTGYDSMNNLYPVLERQLPLADISALPRVDMTDPATVWPGADNNADGDITDPADNAGKHPSQCP